MKLINNEKRDVIKHIEECIVMPEKYRFLLFDESISKGKSKVIVENVQIVEKIKDENGIISEFQSTQNWHNYNDYWSIDFNYESKPEIFKFKTDWKVEEEWTGNYVFENEWQSFRRNKVKEKLELKSSEREIATKKLKLL